MVGCITVLLVHSTAAVANPAVAVLSRLVVSAVSSRAAATAATRTPQVIDATIRSMGSVIKKAAANDNRLLVSGAPSWMAAGVFFGLESVKFGLNNLGLGNAANDNKAFKYYTHSYELHKDYYGNSAVDIFNKYLVDYRKYTASAGDQRERRYTVLRTTEFNVFYNLKILDNGKVVYDRDSGFGVEKNSTYDERYVSYSDKKFNNLDEIKSSLSEVDNKLEGLSKKLDEQITISDLTKLINKLMMDAASFPGYQGVPFSSTEPFTQDEIEKIVRKENLSPRVRDLLDPVELPVVPEPLPALDPVEKIDAGSKSKLSFPAEAIPDLNSDAGSSKNPNNENSKNPNLSGLSNPYVELFPNRESSNPSQSESYPKIDQPVLEQIPTGSDILGPLFNLFPFIKNLSFASKNVVCPTVSFHVLAQDFAVTKHCDLLEKYRSLVRLFVSVVWSFLGLRIVLEA